jgi:trk system potassium uptake protein
MAPRPRSFAVIGLGTFGRTVARELARLGNYVVGLDINERNVSAVAEEISHAVIADGRDDDALREAGVADCDAVIVAIGEDLEANVLSTINVKMFGIKTIWAKATSRTHHRILTKLGATRVIRPEEEVGRHTAHVLSNPLLRDYVSIGNGCHVVSLTIPGSRDGMRLSEFDLLGEHKLRCVGVMRGTEFIGHGDRDCVLREDDYLLVIGKPGDLREFSGEF